MSEMIYKITIDVSADQAQYLTDLKVRLRAETISDVFQAILADRLARDTAARQFVQDKTLDVDRIVSAIEGSQTIMEYVVAKIGDETGDDEITGQAVRTMAGLQCARDQLATLNKQLTAARGVADFYEQRALGQVFGSMVEGQGGLA